MTSSSQTKERAATFVPRRRRQYSLSLPLGFALALVCAALLNGCIADTAEDSDLPWASNKGWEGVAPIAPSISERYE